MDTTQFFDNLWADYMSMTPQANQISTMLRDRGENIINDHVAFRTVGLGAITLLNLERQILALGYSRLAPYSFEEKHLDAWSYIHPDPSQPKIFLSSFRPLCMSEASLKIMLRIILKINSETLDLSSPSLFWRGRPWDPISWDEYQILAADSEYLAWVAALGIRPNHFTVNINHLNTIDSVEQMLELVESIGLKVNESGGRVKGKGLLLEQGSTMASHMDVEFSDGVRSIPTCYYEFAKRHKGPDGELFQGFVTSSADKIFESTNENT